MTKSFSIKNILKKHLKAYKPWEKQEESELIDLYNTGKSIEEIAESLGRQKSGIKTKLKKLVLICDNIKPIKKNIKESEDTIQIAGHVKEEEKWNKIQEFTKMGGYVTRTVSGNVMNVRVYGKIPNAIVEEFVSGKTAIDKGFSPAVWQYSNKFLDAMLQEYLGGDGHNDTPNNRWRLGFTRNYNLERDLRTACARLGYRLILNTSSVKYKDELRPTFKGEIRKVRSGHWNEKVCAKLVEIRKARCRYVYGLDVENETHAFSLASGVLTS